MSLESKVMNDLKEAMKAKDKARMRSLRAIKSALQLEKTSGSGNKLDEGREIKILQKLVKQRQDSLDIYEKQGREDLAITEREELEVIREYLPEQLSDSRLSEIIQEIIEETGATTMQEMGRVMGIASKKLAGKADGKAIADKVKSFLS